MDVVTEPLPAPPVRERRVLPLVALVAVLGGVVFGGYVVSDAIASPDGGPVDVGAIVRLHPPPGWAVAKSSTDPPSVRLTRGNGSLDVLAGPFSGSLADLLRVYVTRNLEPQAQQLSVSRPEPVRLASGLPGLRVSYVGTFGGVATPIEGEVTAVVSNSGNGVILDGWAPSGQLGSVLDDVQAMVDGAEVA
jgi:hypothetical protein